MSKLTRIFIVICSLLLTWQGLVTLLNVPAYVLPSPKAVALIGFHYLPIILTEARYTVIETLLGFLLGALFGIVTALMVAFLKPLRYWLLPVLLITQALPVFAIAPLLVIWFGYGLMSKAITIMIMLFFPVTSAFLDGLQRTPKAYLDMAKIMNANRFRTFRYIRVPAALPNLASGLRVAAVFAPIGALIGEWVGADHGLGLLMIKADLRMQVDLMFACLFVVMSLALFLYFGVDHLLKRWIKW